jgi:porin
MKDANSWPPASKMLASAVSGVSAAVASIADQNGDPKNPGTTFESFFEDREYFSSLEIGWISSFARRYFDNVHVLLWHADPRDVAGTSHSWGAMFSASTFLDDRFMPFFRAAWADGDGSLMEGTISVGLGLYEPEEKDLVALAIGWGRPSDGALRDQWSSELFYRFQITENFAVTPNVHFIVHPALNRAEDYLFFFGVRLRLAF